MSPFPLGTAEAAPDTTELIFYSESTMNAADAPPPPVITSSSPNSFLFLLLHLLILLLLRLLLLLWTSAVNVGGSRAMVAKRCHGLGTKARTPLRRKTHPSSHAGSRPRPPSRLRRASLLPH